MAFDAAVVLALFVFAWLGAHRGGAESAIRLFGLAFAYGTAFLASKLASGPFAEALGGSPWLGLAAAGGVGFLIAHGLVELAARKARGDDDPSDASRIAGAVLGMTRGALLLLPLLWLAAFSESVRTTGGNPALPDLSGARSAGMGQAVAGAAAETLARGGDRGGRVAAKFVAAPGESVAALSALASDPRMRVLQTDAGFWGDIEAGEVEAALARPTFAELAGDARLRTQLADLGLIDEISAVDLELFHDEMATVLREVGPRLQRLKADPALAELLADEELRARAQAGDMLAVLSDPRVRQLVASASASE